MQTDFVVLYLLEGEMEVQYYEDTIRMRKDDLLLINPGMGFGIGSDRDAIYGTASFSIDLVTQVMDGISPMFYVDSARNPHISYQDLREIMQELTSEYVFGSHKTNAAISGLMFRLLDRLIENYQIGHGQTESDSTDVRMSQMMQYIITHVRNDISLNDIASEMFVSASTLSRIFKKNTGMYFSDYVMRLRVRMSLGLLRSSNQNLTQIAMNTGFANSTAYNRSFRKVMGMMPSEYRKMINESGSPEHGDASLKEELRRKGYQFNKKEDISEVELVLDTAHSTPYKSVCNTCVNIGSLYQLSRANMQFHAMQLNEKLHIRYFRIWNIFSDKLLISDGETIGHYNFDMIDQVLDFMVEHRLKPFLDLGKRPDAAVRSGTEAVYFNEEYINFKSRAAWEHLMRAFIEEIVNRYGTEEVSTWIFEMTRDVSREEKGGGLYESSGYDFFDAWRFAYRTIKEKIPGARVGGIGSVIEHDPDYPLDFLTRCVKSNCRPDFVSVLLYPYEISKNVRFLSSDENLEKNRIMQMRRIMRKAGLGHCDLYVSEWNNTIGNRNALNDSCYRAAYIVSRAAKLYNMTEMMAIMAGSDWISHYVDSNRIINGSVGLLTKDSICKPAFYALSFMGNLGPQLISIGDNYILTKKSNGELYLLCWNHTRLNLSELKDNDDIDISKVHSIRYENEKTLEMNIRLRNLPTGGDYIVKKRLLSQQSGSVLDEWGKLGFETKLSRYDVKYLEAISVPGIEMERVRLGKSGSSELRFTLKPQEILFMHIFKA